MLLKANPVTMEGGMTFLGSQMIGSRQAVTLGYWNAIIPRYRLGNSLIFPRTDIIIDSDRLAERSAVEFRYSDAR